MKTINQNFGLKALFTLIIILLCNSVIYAQTAFKSAAGSVITVKGTSNIHDWTMQATSFSTDGSFVLKGDQLQDIKTLNFVLPVANLKAKEDLMTTRAHKALKADEFNKIVFKLTDATVVPGQKIIKVTGNLTIAGATNAISLQANYSVNGDELTCKGSKSIKMSDFKLKAPSYMMGAMKTGDEVTIEFTLKLKN